jgi:hypothetical protein
VQPLDARRNLVAIHTPAVAPLAFNGEDVGLAERVNPFPTLGDVFSN